MTEYEPDTTSYEPPQPATTPEPFTTPDPVTDDLYTPDPATDDLSKPDPATDDLYTPDPATDDLFTSDPVTDDLYTPDPATDDLFTPDPPSLELYTPDYTPDGDSWAESEANPLNVGSIAWLQRKRLRDQQRHEQVADQQMQDMTDDSADIDLSKPDPATDYLFKPNPAAKDSAAFAGSYADLQEAQRAYHSPLGETELLRKLWENAARDKTSFDAARTEFWRSVNNDDSQEAQTVRQILELAGYELQGESNAPRLQLEAYEPLRSEDAGKRDLDLRLSIDHIDPQSENSNSILDASNLRFMTGRDNASRGNRFDVSDNPLYDPRTSLTRAQQDYRERIQDLLQAQEEDPLDLVDEIGETWDD